MEIVYQTCCGIDVHAKFLIACLIQAGTKEKRRFSTMTDDLIKMRQWLVEAGCAQVAIESTGVDWKPVYNLLEKELTVVLINPEHARALRERKTDLQDRPQGCGVVGRLVATRVGFAQLHPTGRDPGVAGIDAVSGDADPGAHGGRQSDSEGHRERHIKLGQVASDVLGVSGRAMLHGLARGETDAGKLANLAQGKLKEKIGELALALQGQLTPMQQFVLGELLNRIDELEAARERVSRQIDRYLNDPAHPKLARALEALDTIPGVGPRVAEVVIAETGVQMRETFPTDAHLASWAGLCPGH